MTRTGKNEIKDMTPDEINHYILGGRTVKTTGAGTAWLMGVLTFYNITDQGELGTSLTGDVLAVLAGIAFASLVIGWLVRSQKMAEFGLFFAAGVYLLRSFFILFTQGPGNIGVWTGIGLVIIAGGAYIREHWATQSERWRTASDTG